jgi:hypothetical protein
MAASFEKQREQRHRLDRLQPLPSPLMIYLMLSSSPVIDSPRLHGGEVLQVRESGEGANGPEERFLEGVPVFISPGGFGLGCTGDGCHWASWAAVRGGIVC